MVDSMFFTLTFLAAIGCGLMAGIFFIFSNTVMHSLASLPVAQGVAAMQAINRVILNPLFFVIFLGPALLSVLLAVSLLWRWSQPGSAYLLAGSLLYLIGSLLVTIGFNVPMNESLDTVNSGSDAATNMWAKYLTNWTMWNHVRTVASLLSAIFLILSLG